MGKAANQRGRLFGRRKPKPVQPEASLEEQAIDPRRDLASWVAWMSLIHYGKHPPRRRCLKTFDS
jgi:hypothetical protein